MMNYVSRDGSHSSAFYNSYRAFLLYCMISRRKNENYILKSTFFSNFSKPYSYILYMVISNRAYFSLIANSLFNSNTFLINLVFFYFFYFSGHPSLSHSLLCVSIYPSSKIAYFYYFCNFINVKIYLACIIISSAELSLFTFLTNLSMYDSL